MNVRVKIGNTRQIIDCAGDQTILTAAIMAGIDYPYACATGNCGTCISKLDAGEVALLPYGDGALSARQKALGLTLACRARPLCDVELAWLAQTRGA